MANKKPKIKKGVPFYHLRKELGLRPASVISLINKGELKLNDYDKIDEESYLKFKEGYQESLKNKPEWMKKSRKVLQ